MGWRKTPEEKAARRATKAAQQRQHERVEALYSAQKALESAQTPKRIGRIRDKSLRAIDLYEDRLVINGIRRPLTPGVEAIADTAGNVSSRSTATRMAAGTLVAGPIGLLLGAAAKKSKDARELYLAVQGPDWHAVAEFDPNAGASVRAFAGQVVRVANNVPAAREARAKIIAEADAHLREVQVANPPPPPPPR